MADREDIFLRARHRVFGGLSQGKTSPAGVRAERKANALAYGHRNFASAPRYVTRDGLDGRTHGGWLA